MARTIVITGATDGLGRALALHLAADDLQLILHGRSPDRLSALRDELAELPGPAPLLVRADLAALDEVRSLAGEIAGLTDRVDALVSNAGIGGGLPEGPHRSVSRDGYELRFAVNYLAGFLLTEQLLPLVQAAPQGRIVNVASIGQAPLDFDDLMLERSYDGSRAYGQSKLAQIISGFELAERLGDGSSVTVNSLHPSTYMPTKMVLENRGYSIDTIEQGVEATSRLVVDESLTNTTGTFFDRQTPARVDAQAYDPQARALLRQRSLALVGLPADAA